MNDKINTLFNALASNKWQGLLVTDPIHIYYLTGFASEPHERFLGLLLMSGDEPVLLVPALDEEKARASCSIARIVSHSDTDHPFELLKRFIHGSIDSFAIEKEHMSVARYEALTAAIGAARYEDLGPVLRKMRVRKSPAEVQRLQHAVELVEHVLHDGLAYVREGMTEIELVAELEYRMKKRGADGPSFATMALFGAKTALPHGEPGTKKLVAGDLLMIDMGVFADGYASDITRTFAFRNLAPELEQIYNTVLQANLAGIAAARPGVTCAAVDLAARTVIETAGYGAAFNHRVGHGLGLAIHEYPSLHGANEEPLIEGMVFTVEPGIYISGKGGVRIEDDVLVTADGVQVLTTFPKELTFLE